MEYVVIPVVLVPSQHALIITSMQINTAKPGDNTCQMQQRFIVSKANSGKLIRILTRPWIVGLRR